LKNEQEKRQSGSIGAMVCNLSFWGQIRKRRRARGGRERIKMARGRSLFKKRLLKTIVLPIRDSRQMFDGF